MFHKILIPVDFSSCSKNALKLAADFALKNKGSIDIINVFTTTSDHTSSDTLITDDLVKNLKNYEVEIPAIKSLEHTLEVEPGLAADVIAAKSPNYDLIIMGTRGKHEIVDKLVGSVALSVIENSSAPVLVIPEHLHEISFKKIVFAADFKKIEHMSSLDNLRDLALAYQSELHLLNVNESPEYITEEEGDEAIELHRFFEDVNHAFFLSENENLEQAIINYTNERGITVLALMPRKHTFLQSLFHRSTAGDTTMQLKSSLLILND